MKVIILRLQGTLISQDGLIAQEVLIVLGALMDATLSSLTREGTLDTPIAQDMQDMPFTGLVLKSECPCWDEHLDRGAAEADEEMAGTGCRAGCTGCNNRAQRTKWTKRVRGRFLLGWS